MSEQGLVICGECGERLGLSPAFSDVIYVQCVDCAKQWAAIYEFVKDPRFQEFVDQVNLMVVENEDNYPRQSVNNFWHNMYFLEQNIGLDFNNNSLDIATDGDLLSDLVIEDQCDD